MKPGLRYIPTEVWVDVIIYPWKSRKELGEIVHRFKNRKFVEILQYCLHDRGKRTLDDIILNKEAIIPRTQMPENIKFFKRIIIWDFDSSALDFLRRISTHFTDVNLNFGIGDANDLTNIRTILDYLAPLLHGIQSINFNRNRRLIPLVQQYFALKMAQVKMLTIVFDYDQPDQATLQASINFCLNWLISEERDPTEPRIVKVYIYFADNLHQFTTAVRQQFLSAVNSCTFAIKLIYYGSNNPFTVFHLENNRDEQLDGQFGEARYCFQISRHKVDDSAREQLQEWVNETAEKSDKSSVIELYGCTCTTIGQINANAGDNEVSYNVEEGEDGPSTSKKHKVA